MKPEHVTLNEIRADQRPGKTSTRRNKAPSEKDGLVAYYEAILRNPKHFGEDLCDIAKRRLNELGVIT